MKSNICVTTHKYRIMATVVLTTIILAVSACSTVPSRDEAETVWGSELNRAQTQPAKPGAHTGGAMNIRPAQLKRVLAQLRFRNQAGDVQHVFTADALARIAEPLSTGLGHLEAGQDLIFSVTQKGGAGGRIVSVFSDATLTTGRMFVADGRLNIIFGRMHAAFEDAYTATGIAPRQTPGRRDTRVDSGWSVLETEYIKHKSGTRGDWVIIDPAAWETAAPAPASEESAVTSTTSPAGNTAAPANPYYRRTRARLNAIKRLRDDGLLSEAEYRDMRQRILEHLVEPVEPID